MAFAFLFFDSVGGGEWLVLLAVVLIVVGPKNLPAAARKMGQVLSQLRRAADEFKRQIMTMDQEMEKAVNDVKKDYIDVAEDVDKTVTGDSSTGDSSTDDYGPGGDLGDGEDRAYDSYGYDGYDETGEMYSDTPPMMGEDSSETPAAETSQPETPPPETSESGTPPAETPEKKDDAAAHQ